MITHTFLQGGLNYPTLSFFSLVFSFSLFFVLAGKFPGLFGLFFSAAPYLEYVLHVFKLIAKRDSQCGPRSVTVWGWNGSSGSGFRFRRFL